MAPRALLDGEAHVIDAWTEARQAGAVLSHDRHRRPDANAAAEADHERVVARRARGLRQRCQLKVRMMHPRWLDVERAPLTELVRDDGSNCRGVLISEVIRAVDADDHREIERPCRPLPDAAVLTEELDRPVARTMNAHLTVPHDPESILKTDLRSRVEAEEVTREVAEIACQRLRKPMRHAECALEPWEP